MSVTKLLWSVHGCRAKQFRKETLSTLTIKISFSLCCFYSGNYIQYGGEKYAADWAHWGRKTQPPEATFRTHVTKAQTLATNIGEADDIHFYASRWIFYFGVWTMCAQCFTDTSLSVDWGLGRKLHETSSRRKSRNQSTFAALQLQRICYKS